MAVICLIYMSLLLFYEIQHPPKIHETNETFR
jgi:hypothetical protein